MNTTETMSEKERYNLYLAGREWGLLKRKVKERSGGICERCKINPSDAVHHLTYERKYNERLEDLQDTCDACHAFLGGYSDIDPIETWNHQLKVKCVLLCHQLVSTVANSPFRSLEPVVKWFWHAMAMDCQKIHYLECSTCGAKNNLTFSFQIRNPAEHGIFCQKCIYDVLRDHYDPKPAEPEPKLALREDLGAAGLPKVRQVWDELIEKVGPDVGWRLAQCELLGFEDPNVLILASKPGYNVVADACGTDGPREKIELCLQRLLREKISVRYVRRKSTGQ